MKVGFTLLPLKARTRLELGNRKGFQMSEQLLSLSRDNKYLDIIPLTFADENLEAWLKSPALVTGGMVTLPHLAFNKGEVKVGKSQNYHKIDVFARKAMLHNLAADNLLTALLNFVNELITDWDTLDKSTWVSKVNTVQRTVKLAYISNSNARQYILAMYVDNKVSFRSYILDMTSGCDE